nr:MAG TPA: hypothetical protein [Caudoviricetes sp.]
MKPGKEIVKDKQKNSSLKHRQKNIVNNQPNSQAAGTITLP